MDNKHAQIIDMIKGGEQPACVIGVKDTLLAKGPFVGYTTIDVEQTVHLGTGETVYAVRTTELVDTRGRAMTYRDRLKRFGTDLDRVLGYVEMLEEIVRGM